MSPSIAAKLEYDKEITYGWCETCRHHIAMHAMLEPLGMAFCAATDCLCRTYRNYMENKGIPPSDNNSTKITWV